LTPGSSRPRCNAEGKEAERPVAKSAARRYRERHHFLTFREAFGVSLEIDTVEFWFMMQIAMMVGFMTSYPVNWWLIRSGLKERM
jgi:uncharacterized protein DUF4396